MKIDGNKTYLVAGAMVLLSLAKHIFPDIPDELYNTARDVLNYLLYGTVGHKLIRTIKK